MLMLTLALLAGPVSTEISLPAQPAPLHGTLLTPESASAVAVILPGSGPTDRDGNNPLGVSASTYRLLADGLAAQGIATLRIDKRGVGQSAAAGGDEFDLRFDAYVADARAWAAEAARRADKPCAWLIGHSEGALIALKAVEDGDEKVCGLVLLSGAGRPAGVVIREQLAALPEPMKTKAFSALTELEAGRTVADTPPALAALFRPSVQPYLISWLPLDPAALVAAYDGPVFIGQGTTDIQVGVADAQALAAADPLGTLKLWDGVNHVLKTAPADRAANIAAYSNPDLPLAPGVVEDVAAFIHDQTGR
ncbi:MAG: alpha/beta fold hydrolase [Alphaproteobacteria bacterium]|uniref:alpha/beta hydrolase n=1 Tax=Brevundimonas sp. TaxID=1871086 RepID=UPI001D5B1C57|nr:alpha/beta fold hydrolase [Alphaproteobacteria bacterium]MBU1520077.1 alpha/beta fold hydrolase [Alphaproteobacteria bacterium]MBU2029788.1 alpha/beta fold hydrolase [Alphaproteobacteria bacterium]MBU2165956.1 alpha/beta fold hydrolase [Alphaproteobacteria bacterium]MBU2231485.1 alpha/beta fold hydrolase [Alphaproteobacteria bacterium]